MKISTGKTKFVIGKRPPPVNYSYSPFVDGVTQSMMGLLFECQEKARKAIVLGLTEATPSKPLIFGDLSHETLDQYYTGMKEKYINTHAEAVTAGPVWIENACEKWYKKNPRATSDAREIVEESAGILNVMFPEYSAHWWEADHEFEWLGIEEKFYLPIDIGDVGSDVKPILTGKMDGRIRMKATKEVWLFETKNKSQMSDKLGIVLPLDLQVGTYLTAIGKMMPNEVVNRCMYNMIKRPGERQGKKETWAEFLKRLAEKVKANRADYFERYRIKMDEAEIAKHLLATELRMKWFVTWWRQASKDIKAVEMLWNGGACENKYGLCKFIRACANDDVGGLYVRPKAHAEL